MQSINWGIQYDKKQNKQKLMHFRYLEQMTNNFQINTIYSVLLSKVHHNTLDNALWKVSSNI